MIQSQILSIIDISLLSLLLYLLCLRPQILAIVTTRLIFNLLLFSQLLSIFAMFDMWIFTRIVFEFLSALWIIIAFDVPELILRIIWLLFLILIIFECLSQSETILYLLLQFYELLLSLIKQYVECKWILLLLHFLLELLQHVVKMLVKWFPHVFYHIQLLLSTSYLGNDRILL